MGSTAGGDVVPPTIPGGYSGMGMPAHESSYPASPPPMGSAPFVSFNDAGSLPPTNLGGLRVESSDLPPTVLGGGPVEAVLCPQATCDTTMSRRFQEGIAEVNDGA